MKSKSKTVLIEVEYNIEDVVKIKNDPDNYKRIITAIKIRPNNAIIYSVSHLGVETGCYGFELETFDS